MRKFLKSLPLIFSFLFIVTTPQPAHASFFYGNTEPTQIGHMAQTAGGWLWDAQAWMQERMTDLDKLLELVENNILTKSIRGFNELMTAIQTDISDVLGTVETLVNAPLDMFNDLASIPGSVIGTFNQVSNLGSEYEGVFNQVTGIFNSIADYQTLGKMDFANNIGGQGSSFSSGFDLSNKVNGLRNQLASDFLKKSQSREDMYESWERDTYGSDAAQMQRIQLDIAKEIVENQNRDQEFMSMDRMQDSADRIAAYEKVRAKTNRLINQNTSRLSSQLW